MLLTGYKGFGHFIIIIDGNWSFIDLEFSPNISGVNAVSAFLSSGRLSPLLFFLIDLSLKIVLIFLFPPGQIMTT